MMSGRISNFIRNFKFALSVIVLIIGLIVFFMGVIWQLFKDLKLGFYTDIIYQLESWNFYLLIIGFILLFIGIWYLYTYFRDRRFLMKELETNKRSELLKKHSELKTTCKHLPNKYQKMFKAKERELNIK
jgi:hypothetical protein